MLNRIPRRSLWLLGVPLHGMYESQEVPTWYPTEDPALVGEMVGAAHSKVKRVRELAEQHPALVRSTIDWGFGDWESALGAASHVGNREIAEFLLDKGAEPTIFSATMLGQLDTVKALISAQPGIQRIRGPHSISLLAHAKAGGEKSAAVVKFLTELGDAGLPLPIQPLTSDERESVVGKYIFGSGERDYFEVDLVRDILGINRPGAPARRNIHHSGGLVFFPVGAPAVKIVFQREDGKVTGFTLGKFKAKRS